MALSPVLVAATAAVTIFLLYTYITSGPKPPKGTRLPPGPPGKPLIGNLPDIPPLHSWLKFKEWGDKYGPLYRLNIAGREHYIVSSEKIANDLLRERRQHLQLARATPRGHETARRRFEAVVLAAQ